MVDIEATPDETKKITGANVKSQVLAGHKDLTTGVHGVGLNHVALAPAASHLVRTFTKGWTTGKLLKGAGADADPTEESSNISCRVFNNANIAITTDTATVLPFNSEDHDTDTMHDPAINNSRITINTAGVYILFVNLQWVNGATTGVREAFIRKNGTDYLAKNPVATTDWVGHSVGVVAQLAANDYVEALVYHTYGSDLSINYESGRTPYFMAARIV